jgi:hypothetical protein
MRRKLKAARLPGFPTPQAALGALLRDDPITTSMSGFPRESARRCSPPSS